MKYEKNFYVDRILTIKIIKQKVQSNFSTQLISILSKFFYKNCDPKTSSRPFYACKELNTLSNNEIFEASYLY